MTTQAILKKWLNKIIGSDSVASSCTISNGEAVKIFDSCIAWLQQQDEASHYNLSVLHILKTCPHWTHWTRSNPVWVRPHWIRIRPHWMCIRPIRIRSRLISIHFQRWFQSGLIWIAQLRIVWGPKRVWHARPCRLPAVRPFSHISALTETKKTTGYHMLVKMYLAFSRLNGDGWWSKMICKSTMCPT